MSTVVNMSKYLEFVKHTHGIARKTDKWRVESIKTRQVIGLIEWYSPWRRYTLYPVAGTIFDANCLRDIATFMEIEMGKRLNK